jgi:hypothetical protein
MDHISEKARAEGSKVLLENLPTPYQGMPRKFHILTGVRIAHLVSRRF